MKGLEIIGRNGSKYIDWKLNGKPGNSIIADDGEVRDAHLCGSLRYSELLAQDVMDEIKDEVTDWIADEEEQAPLFIYQLMSHATRRVKRAVVIAHTAAKAQDLLMQAHPDVASIWGEAVVTEIAPLGETGPFDPVVLAVEEW
jgi:hypothetical protein